MITALDRRHRAAEADRLLREPLLAEAFTAMENMTIEQMLAIDGAEPEDERKRRQLADKVKIIREVRNELRRFVADGLAEAGNPKSFA